MPRTQKVGLTSAERRRVDYVCELVSRDPPARNLFDSFDPELEEDSQGYREYEAEIKRKLGGECEIVSSLAARTLR